jgi:tetratricopeptide (TPR) repeat protein
MKNKIIFGATLSLIVLLSTASHAARLDRTQVESSRVNWIAESEDDKPCDPKKRKPATYYYSISMRAIEPGLEIYCLNQAIKIDPKYVDAYDRRGNAKRKSGNLKGAVADYSMAVKIDPNYGFSYYNRAVARAELKNTKEAIADYTKAIEIFRRNDQTYEMETATKNLAELSPSLNVERTDFDNNPKITSVSDFKDVKPTDEHFTSLQSLTDRYGVIVAYKGSNFYSEIPLSRGQFAMFLDRGLDIVGKITTLTTNVKPKDIYNKFSANNLKLSSVSKIKDISPSSPYYQSVKSLTESYGINFVDADGRFRPEQPLTEKELENWLDGVFRIGKNPTANKKINRGQFVIKFNDTLDLMNDRIAKVAEAK